MSAPGVRLSKGNRETLNQGALELNGRFRFNGASDPTSFVGGWISSVAHTGTGIWTITMKAPFIKNIGVFSRHVSLELDASANSTVSFGPISLSAGTIVVRVYTDAGTSALADIAAGSNAGNWCHLTLILKKSKQRDGSGL